jgi:putative inorganic carbon (HCO3(-)) transporter
MNEKNDSLLSLKLRLFLSEFRAESVALWFLCFYVFIEYIRPHGMYPALNFLPWGQVSILLAFASVVFTGAKANGFGVMDSMFILFSLIVILSAVFAWNPSVSLKYWSTYTSWILMYFCIVSILTTPNRIFIFVLFFCLINFKLSEHGARTFAMRGFSFAHWGLSGPPGWFNNSGEFSMQMVFIFSLTLSILLAAKKYIGNPTRWKVLFIMFPGTSALTVIGSSSRGGQVALAAIILIFVLRGKKFFRNALLLIFTAYFVLQVLPEEQLARFNTIGDDETSQMRYVHWGHAQRVIANHPMGIGYFNWRDYYPANFDLAKYEEIHNTILQSFVELGYPGGSLFLLMIITGFFMNMRTRREMITIDDSDANAMAAIAQGLNLGLLGTLLASFFMSVLYHPSFWLVFALTSALRHISRKKLGI